MIDLRQTKEYAKYMVAIGWTVERIENTNYFIKTLPLLGSVLKIQRPGKIDLKMIETLARKYKSFQIILEPQLNYELGIRNYGFKLSKSPYLPSKTIYIDLTKNDDALLSAMHHKTRYNIKVAEKNGVQVETSDDIKTFANLWQKEAKERGFFISQEKEIAALYNAFNKNGSILVASIKPRHAELISASDSKTKRRILKQVQDDKLIEITSSSTPRNDILGGILLLFTKDICYYMYAFSTKEGKKLFAPTLLVWKALQIAKNRKVKLFDFEGIYDERFPLPRWKGFSRFKKSFGGEETSYPGAFVKWRLPF